MMRLFVALEPSPAFRNALDAQQHHLRAAGVTGLFLPPSNLHLTLAFIGTWPSLITDRLPQVRRPFPITLSHLGVFPKARVLWAGTEPSEELSDLACAVRRALADAEIPFDPKPFNPHITLIRKPVIPENVSLSEIEVPPVAMMVRSVCLYRSDHGESGMVYTVVGRGGSV